MHFDPTNTKEYQKANAKLETLEVQRHEAYDKNDMNRVCELQDEICEYQEVLKELQLKIYDNVNIKFTKMDRLIFTNLDRII